MTTEQPKENYRELRFLADNYEQSQRLRIQTGERIRAVIQGRDKTFVPSGQVIVQRGDAWADVLTGELYEGATPIFKLDKETGEPDKEAFWVDPEGEPHTADETLRLMQRGVTSGPVFLLGRSHARYYTEERETYGDMKSRLLAHPAWPWLDSVIGIGETLACKLLGRFEVRLAPHDSSFWKYAGLDTVPAKLYRCAECRREEAYPETYQVTGTHKALGTQRDCKGKMEYIKGPGEDNEIRCARRRPGKGQKAEYDQYAKKVVYLAASSFLKVGDKSPYERFYRKERQKAEEERSGWSDARKHYLALRKTQKLFLSHLWEVWRLAEGMEVSGPYAMVCLGHSGKIDPWEMVGEGR